MENLENQNIVSNGTSDTNNTNDTLYKNYSALEASEVKNINNLSDDQKTIDVKALEAILKYLLLEPEKLEVNRKVDEMGVLLSIKVSQNDMGAVIGRGGEMANSIKRYIKKVGQINNMNVRVRIEEPEGSTKVFVPKVRVEHLDSSNQHDYNKQDQKEIDDLEEFVLS
jgi:uncharacterized protein